MNNQINIAIQLDQLDLAFIKEMKEKYGNAELKITVNRKPDFQPLTEEEFWQCIDLLDWEKEKNDEIIEPLVAHLATLPVGQIYNFQEWLAQKLYQLDQQKFAERIGQFAYREDEYFSVDHFLHVRACVIANGKEVFDEVLANPTEMVQDLTFEPLLTVASTAYQRKTKKPFIYVPSRNIETYANEEGWQKAA